MPRRPIDVVVYLYIPGSAEFTRLEPVQRARGPREFSWFNYTRPPLGRRFRLVSRYNGARILINVGLGFFIYFRFTRVGFFFIFYFILFFSLISPPVGHILLCAHVTKLQMRDGRDRLARTAIVHTGGCCDVSISV